MKKHRKFIAFFLVILIAALIFLNITEDDKEITTIRIWTGDGQNKLLMTQKVDEFNKTVGREEGFKIEYRVIRSGLGEELKKAAQRNDLPEIFGLGSNELNLELRKAGKIIPINKLPGGSDYLRQSVPELIAPLSEDGKEREVYVFPVREITGRLIYNKDLFRKAGLVDKNGNPTPPETWEEFITYSKRIHDTDSTKFGTAFPLKEPRLMNYGLSWAVKESLPSSYEFDYKNRTCRDLVSETVVNILSRIKKDGSCFPAAHTLDNDTLRHRFARGNIGMFLACSWDVGVLTEQFPAKCDWGVAPYPTLERGTRYSAPEHINSSMYIGISALKNEETAKAVMKVYQWLYSEEVQLWHYEAEQWILTDKKICAKADESKMSEQWLAFCKQPKITAEKKQIPSVQGASPNIYVKAWTGEISFNEAIKLANETATKSFRKALDDGTIIN